MDNGDSEIVVFFDRRNPTIVDLYEALVAEGRDRELRLAVSRSPFFRGRKKLIMLRVGSIERTSEQHSFIVRGESFPEGDGVGLVVTVVYQTVERIGILTFS